MISVREHLDERDKKDLVRSVFSMDRDGAFWEAVEALRGISFEREGNDEEAKNNSEDLLLRQARELMIKDFDVDSPVTQKDIVVLNNYVLMTNAELDFLETYVRVSDKARCYFLSEMCSEPVQRYLNAARIEHKTQNGEEPSWKEVKACLMDRLKDTSVADGLLSYLLRPREEWLASHLWVAERMTEKRWLTADGVRMDSATWLAFTLAFITNEERQVLGCHRKRKKGSSLWFGRFEGSVG